MKNETRERMKDNLVRINEASQFLRGKMGLTWWKRDLIKIYLASPRRVQFLLAKIGIRRFLKRKKDKAPV